MKRTSLLLFLLFPVTLLPIACLYDNSPYNPGHYPHPLYTPTVDPTYAVPTPPYKTSWGTAGGPNGLALGMGTTLFVAEGDNSIALVEVFDSSNPVAPLAQWTGYGATPFGWPGGVVVDPVNNNVYVTDNTNNAVYEFTSAGVTVATWNAYGSQRFIAPEGIGVDLSGNIYVVDTGNNQVDEFDMNGNPLHRIFGSGFERLYQPSAVALDASGNIYVADAGNERVIEFSPGGTSILNQWSSVKYADLFGIAIDGSGDVFAADYGDGTPYNGNGLVEEYDPAGNLMALWGSSTGTYPFGPDAVVLSGPDVLVADYNNDLIQVFGP